MPWYRCVFVSKDTTVELTLDVLTDDDGRVDSGLMFFGYWRDKETGESQPFALTYDGRLDWGESYTSTFPIRGKQVAGGLRIPYAGYQSSAKLGRREVHYQNDFILKTYVDYAERKFSVIVAVEQT